MHPTNTFSVRLQATSFVLTFAIPMTHRNGRYGVRGVGPAPSVNVTVRRINVVSRNICTALSHRNLAKEGTPIDGVLLNCFAL